MNFAMALDSKAYFFARLSKIGLGDEKETFAGLGWSTMGDFANAANYRPTAPDDAPFIKDVILPLFGDEGHPKKAAVRRLFFEAFGLFAADINRRSTMPDDDEKPKKRKAKKTKDPNAPKKPLSSYFRWLGENRSRIKEELGDDHKVTDVSKEGGRQCKLLTDEEKALCETSEGCRE